MRIYNPQEKKLNPRTISEYFIGYAERSKGYRFYCPYHIIRTVESRNVKFLEDDLINRSDQLRDLGSEIDHIESQPSASSENLWYNPKTFDQAMSYKESNLWYGQ